jgi:hypothetical protein
MKRPWLLGVVLFAVALAGGCVSGGGTSSKASSGGASAHCLSRPDPSGTQPLFYLLCIQSN